MKQLMILLFALISINAAAQPWETVKGNGQAKKETRQVNAFTSLSSGGAINVEITYGKTPVRRLVEDFRSQQISGDYEKNIYPDEPAREAGY